MLLALYDTLNDDDEEVRDLGSAALKHVAGVSLVPVEAAGRLLQRLAATFGSLPQFRAAVAGRIVGAWSPAAERQLAAALRFDDSLFAVEEQNLFVDEVRETRRWVAVFDSLSWSAAAAGSDAAAAAAAAVLASLESWVRGGIDKLTELAQGEQDGPLGWASDAHAFAIATRIVHGYLVLVRSGSAGEELTARVEGLKQAALRKDNNVSRLLMDALN